MRPGFLRDRVQIEQPVRSKNPTTGANEVSYTSRAKRKAQIKAVSTDQQPANGSEQESITVDITVRYDKSLKDVEADCRVVDVRTGRIYELDEPPFINSQTKFLVMRGTYRSK